MSSPALPRVLDALQTCGAKEVHERFLDMLNLLSVSILPPEMVLFYASQLGSAHLPWARCVVDAIIR